MQTVTAATVLVLLVGGLLPALAHAQETEDPSLVEQGLTISMEWFVRKLGADWGSLQTSLGGTLGKWLVSIPNFRPCQLADCVNATTTDRLPVPRSGVDELEAVTTGFAIASLSAVLTIAVVRYWIGGLAGSGAGGAEMLEGFKRTLLAVGMILVWPEFFRLTIALTNSFTYSLLDHSTVTKNFEALWGTLTVTAAGTGKLGLIIVAIVFVALIVLLLALAAMKVFLTAATAFLFVAMPVLIVLWPIPAMSYLANAGIRYFLVCLMTPVSWSILFALFGATGMDLITLNGPGNLADKLLIQPFVVISLFMLALQVPRTLGRMAMMGSVTSGQVTGGGGGALSHAAGYAGSKLGMQVLQERFPALQAKNLATLIPGGQQRKGGDGGTTSKPGGPNAGPGGGKPQDPLRGADGRVGSGGPTPSGEAATAAAGHGSAGSANGGRVPWDLSTPSGRTHGFMARLMGSTNHPGWQETRKAAHSNLEGHRTQLAGPDGKAYRAALAGQINERFSRVGRETLVGLSAALQSSNESFAYHTSDQANNPRLSTGDGGEQEAFAYWSEMPAGLMAEQLKLRSGVWEEGGAIARGTPRPPSPQTSGSGGNGP